MSGIHSLLLKDVEKCQIKLREIFALLDDCLQSIWVLDRGVIVHLLFNNWPMQSCYISRFAWRSSPNQNSIFHKKPTVYLRNAENYSPNYSISWHFFNLGINS